MNRAIKFTIIFLITILVSFFVADQIYPLSSFESRKPQSYVVYAENGEILRAFPDKKGIFRFKTSFKEVPKDYIEALLHYEDRYFFTHIGVNPFALTRAMWQWIWSGEIVSGGSTITMQVARLLYPHSKTLTGKAYQIFRALQLELYFSKVDILNMYLNSAPYGGIFEGLATASYQYFRKQPYQLTTAESALLAVLPQSPSRYRPDKYPRRATKARNKVLDRLLKQGIWSHSKVRSAKLEPIAAYPTVHSFTAPLFTQRQKVNSKEKHIYTTIDINKQREIEQLAKDYVHQLPSKVTAAILVSSTKTGSIVSYIGNAAYGNTEKSGYVDIINANRSPGSTLKPFLYAYALDEGLIHSASMLIDAPIVKGDYRPTNFNGSFSGPVAAYRALQQSLNAPVLRLLNDYGARKFEDNLRTIGLTINHSINSKANLSTILGGQSASLEQLHGAYSKFARLATGIEPHLAGLSREAAWVTAKILSDTERPKTLRRIFGRNNNDIAWKTGTSYGYRDSWTIGFNRDYVVSVWVGNPSGAAVPGMSGFKSAAPLFFRVMRTLNANGGIGKQPSTVARKTICWPLGRLEEESKKTHCHVRKGAWLIKGQVPPTNRNNNTRNPLPVLIGSKSQKRGDVTCMQEDKALLEFALWPQEVEAWLPKKYKTSQQLPSLLEGCKEYLGKEFSTKIVGVSDGDILTLGKNKKRTLTLANSQNKLVNWYVNGELKQANSANFKLLLNTEESIQLVLLDDAGNVDKRQFSVIHITL